MGHLSTRYLDGIDEKIALMRSIVARDARLGMVQVVARMALSEVEPGSPKFADLVALCQFTRRFIRYAKERGEFLSGFEFLLRLPVGDCDCSALFLATLLESQQWRTEFALAYDAQGRPVHVWVKAWAPELGRWVHLDPSTSSVPCGAHPVEWMRDQGRAEEFRREVM